MDTHRRSKIQSKYHRLQLSGELRNLIRAIGAKNLVETQIGDYIYRAKGKFQIGETETPIEIRVKMIRKTPRAAFLLPRIGIHVMVPMDPKKVKERLKKIRERLFN